MKKFIVQYCHAQMAGTDSVESCMAENAEEAAEMFYDTASNWAEGFSYDDAEESQFDEECNWECWAEEYDPEKHDGLRFGNSKWAWEF